MRVTALVVIVLVGFSFFFFFYAFGGHTNVWSGYTPGSALLHSDITYGRVGTSYEVYRVKPVYHIIPHAEQNILLYYHSSLEAVKFHEGRCKLFGAWLWCWLYNNVGHTQWHWTVP